MRCELVARRVASTATLRRRFERAKAEGDLPADANPTDLARYVGVVIHGMAVEAASGASRQHLRKVADMALRAWPT